MLEEWISNIPVSLLRQIIADPKARGTLIWVLASEELFRRAQDALAA